MRGRVIVDKEENYKKWEAKQITFKKMLAKNKEKNKLELAKNIK